MSIDTRPASPFHTQVADRFGVLPNFFCTATAAPGLIDELWGFARSAYLDSALPSLFKERLFVQLSRFCEIRYCIVRHVGFLVGRGRPAGDAEATPESVDDVIALLGRPMPDAAQLAGAFQRLLAGGRLAPLPDPRTQAELDLFDALTVIFVEPARSDRARETVRSAVGDEVFEMLAAYLAFVRTAHFWTETHPELAFEPDMLALMEQRPDLRHMLLSPADAERVRAGGDLRRVLAELHQTEAALRDSEARHAFLLALSDTLRPLSDAGAIQGAAMRLLVERLGVARADYDEVDEDQEHFRVSQSYPADRAEAAPDPRVSTRGSVGEAYRRGETLVFDDVATDPRLDADTRAEMLARGASASVSLPLVRHGRLLAMVRVHRAAPHRWTSSEIARLQEAAERTRDAVERARTEAALTQQRAQQQLMLQLVPALLWQTDPDGHAITLNERWQAYTGQSEAETQGQGWLAMIHPDDRPAARAAIEHAFATGKPLEREQRIHKLGDGFRWHLVRHVPVRDADGAILQWFGAAVDIDERKRAEAALRESEERRDLALEATQVGTFVWHVGEDRGEPDARALALFGQPPGGGLNLRDALATVIHPDDGVRYAVAIADACDPGGSRSIETHIRVRRGDGGWRWLEIRGRVSFGEDGQPSRMAGTALDITERKQTEQHLRTSEERQAFLLRLSDGLRAEPDAPAVANFALRTLRDQLGLDRCYIARMSVPDDWAEYLYQVGNDRVPPMPAGVRISSYPEGLRLATEGPWVIDDLATNVRSEMDRRNLAAIGHGALVAAYVRAGEKGEPFWVLSAVSAEPRHWSAGEVSLIEETAERTWAAVERARTEAALSDSEERFRQFGEASQDVLWIRDANSFQWEYLTPAFETVYGLSREAALRADNMTGWLELIVPDDRDHAKRSLERVRDGEWVTFEFRIRRPADGEIRWLRNTDFPIRDGSGTVVRIGGVGHDVTAMKEVERALAAAERRQRALVEGIPHLVWRAVDGGHWTWASPQWTRFTGQSEPDSHDWGWLDPVHPDDRERVKHIWADAIARGEFTADYRICHAGDQRYRWFQTRATPVRDEDGTIIEWLGTSTDVDELRRLQDLQKTLLAELQHRVRNVLAVIRSMMRRSGEGRVSLDEYVQNLEGRLSALARTQVLLTRAVDTRIDLEDLIRDELLAQAADEDKIAMSGPEVGLSPKAAEVVSLAVHELTTNAVKYGALARGDATLRIDWSVEERAGVPWLELVWSELGAAVSPAAPSRHGFGSELITRRVPYELRGSGSLEMRPGGIECRLEFPLLDRASILQTDARPKPAEQVTG